MKRFLVIIEEIVGYKVFCIAIVGQQLAARKREPVSLVHPFR